MQQRKGAFGRPSGTDGSDFSYRMVVDSRYTKVAKGKSRLKFLIAAQTFNQVIGSLWVLLSAAEEKEFNRFGVLSSFLGFISPVIGELGRRHSQGNLLRFYIIISFIATALSFASVVRNDSFVTVIRDKNVTCMTNHDLVEIVRVIFGVLLQIFVVITTVSLVRNMSPPKRSS